MVVVADGLDTANQPFYEGKRKNDALTLVKEEAEMKLGNFAKVTAVAVTISSVLLAGMLLRPPRGRAQDESDDSERRRRCGRNCNPIRRL
jgi:hypothetical protein